MSGLESFTNKIDNLLKLYGNFQFADDSTSDLRSMIPFPIFNVIKCQYVSLQFNAFFEQKLALATGNGMNSEIDCLINSLGDN